MRRLTAIHIVLILASTLPLLATTRAQSLGDLPLYFTATKAWLGGATPYAEVAFEYPPYALVFFAPAAAWAATVREFQRAFGVELAVFDVAIKVLLLWSAAHRRGIWRYAPFLAYVAVGGVQAFWLFKRFDLIPAAFTLLAVIASARGRAGLAAAALGIGIGTKMYPLVMLPVLGAVALRQRNATKFVLGGALAMAPLVALALIWPIGHAGAFHAGRGLQVESLWASTLWLFHSATGVIWVPARAAYEIQGGLAVQVLPCATVIWLLGTAATMGSASVLALRGRRQSPSSLAVLTLSPLLAFVCLSPVLSPQYVLWLSTVAALLLEPQRWKLAVLPLAAALLTRLTYPAPGYQTGLAPALTAVLVVRNLLFVSGLVWLCVELQRRWVSPTDLAG